MNIPSLKNAYNIALFITAIIIGLSSLLYTNFLIKKLSVEERTKISLWAEAAKEIDEVDLNGQISLIVYRILNENKTIPVILVGEDNRIITSMNLDSAKIKNESFIQSELETMKSQHEPIVINYNVGQRHFIYYKDSTMLTQLFYYPYIQLGVIGIFILISYFAFRTSRRAEENQVWVGMSKETAHQLGTPISSLVAWVELLKMRNEDPHMVNEVEKDVKRLETITERFSKIGASPVLLPTNINEILFNSIQYLKKRTSSKVNYIQNFNPDNQIIVPLNIALFEWVIENLCKNAIDAMSGIGTLEITVFDHAKNVYVEVNDTGKGLPKSKFKTIFKPGYTTKKRGWGLGLSLAKRIIDYYHQGKIYVKNSELNKGTTFRIILQKK